jgi:hypothetical protein
MKLLHWLFGYCYCCQRWWVWPKTGAVIDVEYILGKTDAPKVSERDAEEELDA